MNVIRETHFQFPNQTSFYRGKVRDVYTIGDTLIAVASDRISAFDVILPEPIPDKGRVLNLIATYHLNATKDIVPNWLTATPDPNVAIGARCEPFAIEMVVRGYLAGHAWREYQAGKRQVCGVPLPDGLNENDKLPSPILTPSTKATEGHDEDISEDEILNRKLATPSEYALLKKYALQLFARGTEIAAKRGLILVDTKYEFGKKGNEILLIDEVHTPDSSRYFYAADYEANQQNKRPQKQLSKEFVRQWLIENNFQGKPGQTIPTMTKEVVNSITARYHELYQQVMGEKLPPLPNEDILTRVEKNIRKFLL